MNKKQVKRLVKIELLVLVILFVFMIIITPVVYIGQIISHPVSFAISLFSDWLSTDSVSDLLNFDTLSGGELISLYKQNHPKGQSNADLVNSIMADTLTEEDSITLNQLLFPFVVYSKDLNTDIVHQLITFLKELYQQDNYTSENYLSKIKEIDYFVSNDQAIATDDVLIGYIDTLNYTSNDGLVASADGFMMRTTPPSTNNPYWYSYGNPSYPSFIGQCTWYVNGRMREILEGKLEVYGDMFLPNARDFYKANENMLEENRGFASSTDYNKPRVGAIIVWSGGSTLDGNGVACGHVAMIEAINPDGTIDISHGATSFTNYFIYQTVTIDWIKAHGKYNFVGYIYLLE